MKIRNGFVSNSSSSSFVCDVCGNVESGMDMSYKDAGFVYCEDGHEMCERHLIKSANELTKEEIIQIYKNKIEKLLIRQGDKIDEYYTEYINNLNEKIKTIEEQENFDVSAYIESEEEDWDNGYEVPSILCPICNMVIFSNDDLISYLKSLGLYDNYITEIKEKFKNYNEFKDFLIKLEE